MIESLEIDIGILGVQLFYDGKNFHAYDPGFRIQGEGPHFYLQGIYEYDQIKMLLEFAIKGDISDILAESNSDPSLAGYVARTIWILGKPGIVSKIIGLEEIIEKANVLKILNRFLPGDELSEDMVGTERQVLMRIYTFAKSEIELDDISHCISETVQVIDCEGISLISDLYIPFK